MCSGLSWVMVCVPAVWLVCHSVVKSNATMASSANTSRRACWWPAPAPSSRCLQAGTRFVDDSSEFSLAHSTRWVSGVKPVVGGDHRTRAGARRLSGV